MPGVDPDRIRSWIARLRRDPIVGDHTSSVITDCWSDADLERRITDLGLDRWSAVLAWARDVEWMWQESRAAALAGKTVDRNT